MKDAVKHCFWCIAAALCILCLCSDTYVAANWTEVFEESGIKQDPVTGDIIFVSIDKEKTSDIYYRTQGFTIADGTIDASGQFDFGDGISTSED